MYRLKEIRYLANFKLKRILAKEGYIPSKFTPGLFTHKTRNIAFSLFKDNFGVKYVDKVDTEYLAKTILDRYPIKINWELDFYLGMTMEWEYQRIEL